MKNADSNQLVVSTETAGLGNRIKSWVSAMRLGNDARVYWPVTENMPAAFSELFANSCEIDEVPAEARQHISWRLEVLPEDEAYLPAGFAVVGGGAHPLVRAIGKAIWQLRGRPNDRYRYMIFPKSHSRRSSRADGRHLDLEYGRIPEYFRNVYVPLFARIRPLPEIKESVAAWAATNIEADTIGVQVRTWRDDPRRYRKYHVPSTARLLRLMRSAPTNARFFVVSDSDDIAGYLRKELGENRILQYPRETARLESWRSVRGMQEDLIDMLLLARTQHMFASYLSTFSETAWWLGGARARVDVF